VLFYRVECETETPLSLLSPPSEKYGCPEPVLANHRVAQRCQPNGNAKSEAFFFRILTWRLTAAVINLSTLYTKRHLL
jgi:hypothetical protein